MVFRTAIGALGLASATISGACATSPRAPTRYGTDVVADRFTIDELPDSCATMLARVNGTGPDRLPAWVDLARCVAKSAIAQVPLDDSPASAALLEEMTGPSFVLLDHVLDTGRAATKIFALRAKADLYVEMRDQMLATVPRPGSAGRRPKLERVERMIEPWEEHARATHRAIVALGDSHPELSSNPQVQLAIHQSERALAVPVAAREH